MRILAFETSCDETAAAVVEKRKGEEFVRVFSDVVASSSDMHVTTGGIVPEVAAREQVRSIIPVIEEALRESRITNRELGAIAVTVGPGLIGSLLVGVETAKTLALVWDKPLIPVNHLIAHLYANWVGGSEKLKVKNEKLQLKTQNYPTFPAIGMVVSGGHTDIVLMKSHTEIEWLGGTRDDAAGECFDKCARILGLPYPGGPAVAEVAAKFKIKNSKLKIKLPRPLIDQDTLDLSFSGLKTALARMRNEPFDNAQGKQKIMSNELTSAMAYEVQEAITDVLVVKVMLAVRRFKPKSVLLGGGVAANERLREKLEARVMNHKSSIKLHISPPKLCTDNAVSIGAWAAFHPTPASILSVRPNPSLAVV
ncbi:tRNA (adenosine(37)-N6)-threonylcarbamoyltransferase complex transferase subunit TsaD [Microgenomates group bacterium RIFCSPHIGHO2_01_FULL_45_11]|nr:MAG: tRNA (adenosine(37)-N6)-threonylcarbamoyltransferase complex transferase subunit TsaD [Microgenomates group bacterium RIFCSPHIGHO2_01_FULL_45_11]